MSSVLKKYFAKTIKTLHKKGHHFLVMPFYLKQCYIEEIEIKKEIIEFPKASQSAHKPEINPTTYPKIEKTLEIFSFRFKFAAYFACLREKIKNIIPTLFEYEFLK